MDVDRSEQRPGQSERARSVQAGVFKRKRIVGSGNLINNPTTVRTNDNQLTLAGLPGVAVQNFHIATSVLERISAP